MKESFENIFNFVNLIYLLYTYAGKYRMYMREVTIVQFNNTKRVFGIPISVTIASEYLLEYLWMYMHVYM